jgi:hypothetical protein
MPKPVNNKQPLSVVDSLNRGARTLHEAKLDDELRSHGWSRDNTERLATYLERTAKRLMDGWVPHPIDNINLAVWLDGEGVTLKAEDQLSRAAFDAIAAFNAVAEGL